MAITFQNQDSDLKLKNKARLKAWIDAIIKAEKKKTGTIAFAFASDQSVLEANRQFLDHDTYTDIITFDSCEGNVINGDIIISVERVMDNASKFNVPFETELHRVIIHGVLHLLGYKDKSKKDAELMRKMEDKALRKLDLANAR